MTIDWSKSPLIPRSDLLAWNFLPPSFLPNGNPVSVVPDWSGSGRGISASANYPQLSKQVLNGHDGVYFDGTKNPLKYSGAMTPKQIFIVAGIETEEFAGNEGLLSDLTSVGLLAGNGAGTTKFYNFGYAPNGYTYRRNDFVTGEANQLAPLERFCVLELRFPMGIALDGFQIGQDRNFTDRKLNGVFMELLMYSAIQPDYETRLIYQYFARKFHLWQENGAGKFVFPFYTEDNRSRSQGRTIYKSKPYSGPATSLLRGGRGLTVEASFAGRRATEFEAADVFHAEHHGIKEFVFRDFKFVPPKDSVMEFTSELKDSGASFGFFDYSFSAATGEISQANHLVDEDGDHLVVG